MYIYVVVGLLEDFFKFLGFLKEIKMGLELKNCGLEILCEGIYYNMDIYGYIWIFRYIE